MATSGTDKGEARRPWDLGLVSRAPGEQGHGGSGGPAGGGRAPAGSADVLVADDAPAARPFGPPDLLAIEPLGLFIRPWQILPGRPTLTIVAKAVAAIEADGATRLQDEIAFPQPDEHRDGDPTHGIRYPSDFALLKPRADITLVGTAHAPKGSGEAMVVRFQFGRGSTGFDRSIAVFGDRQWSGVGAALVPTAPARFKTMPLEHERAFGGPGLAENPLGRGLPARAGGALPNLEQPGALITAPTSRPVPACFAPVPPSWPSRWSRVGTYDGGWRRERWPYFPEDFDYSFFQAAPAEQQLTALRGDEPYEVVGLHSHEPVVRGRLPSLRVRCFALRTRDAGAGFFEVPLRLDTVHFDFDAQRCSLLWRGVLEVRASSAPELASLFVMHEPLGVAPCPLEQALERYRAELAVRETPAVVGESAAANDATRAEQVLRLEAAEQAADEAYARALAGAAAEESAYVKKVEQAVGRNDIDALIREHGAGASPAGRAPRAALLGLLERADVPPEHAEALRELLEQAEADTAAHGAPDAGSRGTAGTTPEADEAAEAANLRAKVIAMLGARQPLDGMDLADAELDGIDFTGGSLCGALLRGASLRGCRLRDVKLQGAILARADLSDAELDRALLDRADLTGAKLLRARCAGALLRQADLSRVDATDADFQRAVATDASFFEANLTAADFSGARLERADMARATIDRGRFDGADCTKISLLYASGEKASFVGAALVNARAHMARLPSASFARVSADESAWIGATLEGASFRQSKLRGANFAHAACGGVSFAQVDLGRARLDECNAAGAVLQKANLMEASLQGADLREADLRGANLYGAALWRADLGGAKLDGAILKATTLREPAG